MTYEFTFLLNSFLYFLELNQPDYFNYALEQRNATKQQLLATDIQAEIDKVNRADLVIL
ncbi:flavodoxin family protein, partial [Acinetobacter baumannii]|nr:flavodoxin family protein [Acinetobacter baumannii]